MDSHKFKSLFILSYFLTFVLAIMIALIPSCNGEKSTDQKENADSLVYIEANDMDSTYDIKSDADLIELSETEDFDQDGIVDIEDSMPELNNFAENSLDTPLKDIKNLSSFYQEQHIIMDSIHQVQDTLIQKLQTIHQYLNR